jgi:hypothetical protein
MVLAMKLPARKCQACESGNLELVLSLGYLPPPNDMWPIGTEPDRQAWLPTDLYYCSDCTLVQLGYEGPQEVIFPLHYPYTSGVTKVLRDNFADLYNEMETLFGLDVDNDRVIDIGSNDGTLLSNFAKAGIQVLGVEPTNIAKVAKGRGIRTMQAFFNSMTADMIHGSIGGTRRFVTCANCFAHMSNLPDIMAGIIKLIGNNGVFVSESTYWMDTLRDNSYDTIYHEHLRYYTLTSIRNLFRRYGLEVFHVKRIPTAGGAIRVYAAKERLAEHLSRRVAMRTVEQLLIEEQKGGSLIDRMHKFAYDVKMSKYALMQTLGELRMLGYTVAGISAPSRAATVINYCRLELDYIAELPASLKMGLTMAGTDIPVIDESILFGPQQPEAAVLFSWHIADEVIPKLRARGFNGKIILPCARV